MYHWNVTANEENRLDPDFAVSILLEIALEQSLDLLHKKLVHRNL
jgi:hypothetical protein